LGRTRGNIESLDHGMIINRLRNATMSAKKCPLRQIDYYRNLNVSRN
jgi:hypothetical protein